MEGILNSKHPSFGTQTASFLFAIGTKLLVVETKNPYAVATMERLLVKNKQMVSETCRVICVFRDCRDVGIRDDDADEIPYIEFMTDMVDPEWLLKDAITLACFSKSITPEEQRHALAREKAFKSAPQVSNVKEPASYTPASKDPSVTSGTREQLKSALLGMGFKKVDIEKFIRGLGPRVDNESVTDLLREGLRSLAS